jgi:hypothetical protein
MEQHQLVAMLLAAVGVVDLLVGFTIVIPRVSAQQQQLLKIAFVVSFLILWALAGAFLLDILPVS